MLSLPAIFLSNKVFLDHGTITGMEVAQPFHGSLQRGKLANCAATKEEDFSSLGWKHGESI